MTVSRPRTAAMQALARAPGSRELRWATWSRCWLLDLWFCIPGIAEARTEGPMGQTYPGAVLDYLQVCSLPTS
jgi:hypothetical protein